MVSRSGHSKTDPQLTVSKPYLMKHKKTGPEGPVLVLTFKPVLNHPSVSCSGNPLHAAG